MTCGPGDIMFVHTTGGFSVVGKRGAFETSASDGGRSWRGLGLNPEFFPSIIPEDINLM